MVTLAIMAVLVLVAVPMAELAVRREQERELRGALGEIREALDAYKRAAVQRRILVPEGGSGYPPSLQVLVDGVEPVDGNGPRLYFLRRLPPDPMYEGPPVEPALTWGLRSYASPPDEPSEGEDVFDIHSRSERVGLNGVPYRRW